MYPQYKKTVLQAVKSSAVILFFVVTIDLWYGNLSETEFTSRQLTNVDGALVEKEKAQRETTLFTKTYSIETPVEKTEYGTTTDIGKSKWYTEKVEIHWAYLLIKVPVWYFAIFFVLLTYPRDKHKFNAKISWWRNWFGRKRKSTGCY